MVYQKRSRHDNSKDSGANQERKEKASNLSQPGQYGHNLCFVIPLPHRTEPGDTKHRKYRIQLNLPWVLERPNQKRWLAPPRSTYSFRTLNQPIKRPLKKSRSDGLSHRSRQAVCRASQRWTRSFRFTLSHSRLGPDVTTVFKDKMQVKIGQAARKKQ
jgi:hypothetical protein